MKMSELLERIAELERENAELKASLPEIRAQAIKDAVNACVKPSPVGLPDVLFFEDMQKHADSIRKGEEK